MKFSFLSKKQNAPETLKIKVGFLGNDADSDWKTLFYGAIILLACLTIVTVFIFILTWSELRKNTFVPANFDFIDKQSLAEVEDVYASKALLYEKWKGTESELVDPSI